MKSLMLVSQSNTGSSWFASAIRASCPDLHCPSVKEWFNPVLNWEHQDALSCFGSEMSDTIKNLAAELRPAQVEAAVKATWDASEFADLGFTKENYLAFQIQHEAFTNRFNMIGLLGDVKDCFPPARHRVKIWYDNWYASLMMNGRFTDALQKWLHQHCNSCEKRALVGWQWVRWQLESTFSRLDIPVVYYSLLMKETEVSLKYQFGRLGLPQPIVPKDLARVVVDTRVLQERPAEHAEQWEAALAFLSDFQELCATGWPFRVEIC